MLPVPTIGAGKLAPLGARNAVTTTIPLLFIESIPARETRVYLKRVLANLWIYRYRMGEDVPSLDQVAEGDWPIYDKQDHATTISLGDPGGSGVAESGVTSATLAPVAH